MLLALCSYWHNSGTVSRLQMFHGVYNICIVNYVYILTVDLYWERSFQIEGGEVLWNSPNTELSPRRTGSTCGTPLTLSSRALGERDLTTETEQSGRLFKSSLCSVTVCLR